MVVVEAMLEIEDMLVGITTTVKGGTTKTVIPVLGMDTGTTDIRGQGTMAFATPPSCKINLVKKSTALESLTRIFEKPKVYSKE